MSIFFSSSWHCSLVKLCWLVSPNHLHLIAIWYFFRLFFWQEGPLLKLPQSSPLAHWWSFQMDFVISLFSLLYLPLDEGRYKMCSLFSVFLGSHLQRILIWGAPLLNLIFFCLSLVEAILYQFYVKFPLDFDFKSYMVYFHWFCLILCFFPASLVENTIFNQFSVLDLLLNISLWI